MLIRVGLISGLVWFSPVVFSPDVLFLSLLFECERQNHKVKNPKRDQRVENLRVLHHSDAIHLYFILNETAVLCPVSFPTASTFTPVVMVPSTGVSPRHETTLRISAGLFSD